MERTPLSTELIYELIHNAANSVPEQSLDAVDYPLAQRLATAGYQTGYLQALRDVLNYITSTNFKVESVDVAQVILSNCQELDPHGNYHGRQTKR